MIMKVIPIIKSFFLPKMSCEDVNSFLADYIDGQLEPKTHKAFVNHLAMCPKCVPFFEQYQSTVALVRDEDEMDFPEAVVDHTLAFLRSHMNGNGQSPTP